MAPMGGWCGAFVCPGVRIFFFFLMNVSKGLREVAHYIVVGELNTDSLGGGAFYFFLQVSQLLSLAIFPEDVAQVF